MSKKRNPDTDAFYQKLMSATNAIGANHFTPQAEEEVKVNIRPDDKISPGMFKPDPLNPGHYKAHSVTIRAMSKDLFVAGSDEFLDLEKPYTCQKCRQNLDLQFWTFCPYCEAPFPADTEAL